VSSPPLTPLPHEFPFRFVDRIVKDRDASHSGEVSVRVTASAWACRSGAGPPPVFFAEMIAQTALLLESTDPDIGRGGYLAGLDDFVFERAAEPGEGLTVAVSLVGAFGKMAKFTGRIRTGETEIARGTVLVRRGDKRT
jgi:3-hydroxymyristoyl/3-hydroxydecanoyl-(acyl carrier protein) dehydratase